MVFLMAILSLQSACKGFGGIHGLCILLASVLCGCSLKPQDVSRQTDETVYSLIESKWDESFSSKADYQVEPFSPQLRQERLQELRDTRILTVSKAVELAVTSSHEYQLAKEQLYLTTLDLRDIQHLYEWTPFSRTTGGYVLEGDREGSGTLQESGISKLLASGAVVSGGLSVGYMDVLSGDFRSGLQTIFQTAVTMPLLRGADRKAVLEALTQAEQNTLYEIRNFNRFRQTFLVSILTEYYRLLLYQTQWKNSQEHYIRLLSISDKIAPLTQAGRLPAFELEQAEQDKLRAWDGYLQTRQMYETQLDTLKLMLNIPADCRFEPDRNEWDVLQSGLQEILLTEEAAVEAALNQRLDLANAFDQTLDAQRHVEAAADALKTDLTLVGLYSPANDNSRRYAFGADPGDLRRIRDRYEATLRLDLPLDREAEKNNYKRALIALSERLRNHQKLNDQIVLEVRKAYRDCSAARQRYQTQKQAFELAQQRLDKTLELLQYSRANSRDVLDAQKDYFQAQQLFAQSVFDYSAAVLELYRDSGVLWVKPNGLWEVREAGVAQK